MKTLPTYFAKGSYAYTQITRTEHDAIYSQSLIGMKCDRRSVLVYEAIRIQFDKERMFNGKVLEAGERYPSSEQWGSQGWTLPDYSSAIKRLAAWNVLHPRP